MNQSAHKPRIIAVCGGSGSGKTTLVRRLTNRCQPGETLVLHMDHYYLDLSKLSPEERDRRNFDHPDAFDVPLMISQVRDLVEGRPIARPTYDFATHTRKDPPVTLEPAPVIIIDGIMSLQWLELRELLDLKIYVDVDDDVRFIRRLQRDVNERGRTVDGVIGQYLSSVKQMHDLYVAPQKYVADIIVSWMDYNERAVDMLAGMVRTWIHGRSL